MTNARNIINKACRKIHVLGRGQPLTADEANDALEALNDFLASLSADATTIFNTVRESFSLTGATTYSIGSGGDFNTTAPIVINAIYVRIGSTDYPLSQMNTGEYGDIGFKSISGTPEKYLYETNTPLASITLYPVGVSGYTLIIDSLKALTSFADLTTDYNLPPGMVDLLVYNLAVRLAPDYEKEAGASVKRIAKDSLTNLQVFNKRNNYPTADLDLGSSGSSGNILSGWYAR